MAGDDSTARRSWLGRLVWASVGVALVALPYLTAELFGDGAVSDLNRMVVLAVGILSVNVAVGYAGLVALGHSAFVGVGAVAATTLMLDHGVPYLATVPVAMSAAFVVGVVIAIPAVRVTASQLAILTIVLAAMFPTLMQLDRWGIADRAGGVDGRELRAVVAPGWARTVLFIDGTPNQQAIFRYFVFVLLAGVAFLLTWGLLRSGPGRAVAAFSVAGPPEAGGPSGVGRDSAPVPGGVTVARMFALAFSAGLGGLSGAMWAMNEAVLHEADFGVVGLAVPLLVGLVVGGIATIEGAVWGAAVVVLLQAAGDRLGLGLLTQAVSGLLLVLATYFIPGGMAELSSLVRGHLAEVVSPSERRVAASGDAQSG